MTATEPEIVTPDNPAVSVDEHLAVRTENALLRAGVDLDSPQGKLVAQAWEGREPDREAIEAHWQAVKPTVVEPVDAADVVPPVEPRIENEADQARERRMLNANSVVEPNPEDKDPRKEAVRDGIAVLIPPPGEIAGTREDAISTGVHVLLGAAANGDRRVLVDESRLV